MGLRDEFKQVPVDVFEAMGDVVVDGILRQHTVSYVAGGASTVTNVDHTIKIVEDVLTDSELGSGIAETGDRKFLVPSLGLIVTPAPKDSVVINGQVWNVYMVETDPAEALWVLFTRQ